MKIRPAFSCAYFVVILFTGGIQNASAQYIITDTIYYDQAWKICEEPIASYYRSGTLASENSVLYFTGEVKDYTMDHKLIMEGVYADSVKNGLFKFYYPNGKLMATGNYEDGFMSGTWQWYYANGNEKAQIYFNADDPDFKFVSFKDENGKSLIENGTGDFTWPVNVFERQIIFNVKGSFANGKRSGKWQYEQPDGSTIFNFTESYDKDGNLKKSVYDVSKGTRSLQPFEFNFSPGRFQTMENIAYNNYFRRNGDSLAGRALMNYLVNHKPTEIRVKNKNFDSAYVFILRSLYGVAGRFDYTSKDIDADIEFRLGPNGFPEDISVTGSGLNVNEKKFLLFFIPKFIGIEMPGTSTIAVEGYHHIYMYNIDASPYYPANLQKEFGMELYFGGIPKQEMLAALKENKKNIRKFLRKIFEERTTVRPNLPPVQPQPGFSPGLIK